MPISDEQAFLVARSSAVDRDGLTLGPVSGVYYDDHTGRPEWVTVQLRETPPHEGPAGDDPPSTVRGAAQSRFVPLASATYSRGRLHLDVSAAQVRSAPPARGDEHLSSAAERQLYRHYGLSPAGDTDVDPASGTSDRTQDEPGGHSLLPPQER
ncbi:hypothetical protein GTQ99_21730 [Kineococcus sp. T13]|uniref:hypothetical protein n=1 Tax=Kineococcus vitellinus TaxID=2696565 RepID=UPI0014136C13|nr:hypothetical protein [Kineococcus vitellinus]NAZ78007.1 hypothetical protein [Kineococcus vitellinus]